MLAVALVVAVAAALRRASSASAQFTYVAIYFIALLGLNILTGYNGQISLGHGAFMAIGALHVRDPDSRAAGARRS